MIKHAVAWREVEKYNFIEIVNLQLWNFDNMKNFTVKAFQHTHNPRTSPLATPAGSQRNESGPHLWVGQLW